MPTCRPPWSTKDLYPSHGQNIVSSSQSPQKSHPGIASAQCPQSHSAHQVRGVVIVPLNPIAAFQFFLLSCLLHPNPLCISQPWPAVAKSHRLGALTQQTFMSHISEAWKSKIRVPVYKDLQGLLAWFSFFFFDSLFTVSSHGRERERQN